MPNDKTPGSHVRNPYGGGPGTGISLPPYFKAAPGLNNV